MPGYLCGGAVQKAGTHRQRCTGTMTPPERTKSTDAQGARFGIIEGQDVDRGLLRGIAGCLFPYISSSQGIGYSVSGRL